MTTRTTTRGNPTPRISNRSAKTNSSVMTPKQEEDGEQQSIVDDSVSANGHTQDIVSSSSPQEEGTTASPPPSMVLLDSEDHVAKPSQDPQSTVNDTSNLSTIYEVPKESLFASPNHGNGREEEDDNRTSKRNMDKEKSLPKPRKKTKSVLATKKDNNRSKDQDPSQRNKNNVTKINHVKKRERKVRAVFIHKEMEDIQQQQQKNYPTLPSNQYTAILRRRAVRKTPTNNNSEDEAKDTTTTTTTNNDNDIFGDVSLGMKLVVVGGRVIVQSLNALSNGLASPAQLAGTIQRGDVLLAIGNVTLVNLPVDQLMEGLRPLSTPRGVDGYFERVLQMRFEAGTGMELLKKHEEGQTAVVSRTMQEPADAMFTLFPMVDQLSGTPLFEEQMVLEKKQQQVDPDQTKLETRKLLLDESNMDESSILPPDDTVGMENLDSIIASALAKQRIIDRERNQSEYFDWKEDLSELLRRTVTIMKEDGDDSSSKRLTQTERLALGRRILQITKILERDMEEIDRGRDLRSFKIWSTNFSVRSGVSARRRFILDTASIRSSRDTDTDSLDENDSVVSQGSDASLDEVDADTLLLGLAARDEIWRKQVLDALDLAILETDHFEKNEEKLDVDHVVPSSEAQHASSNINDALAQQLGKFLFGDMSKLVKHEKRPIALPPNEITKVLFDLTTNLATKTPDEITVFGASSKLSSNVSSLGTSRTDGRSRAAFRADLLLANRFLLDEALPKWLKSFRPLPLDQRRALWPRTFSRPDATPSTFTGQISDFTGRSSEGETVTLDSGGSYSTPPNNKKGLRERVEEQQIDSETRSETCFLVTYYYTHEIVGIVRRDDTSTGKDGEFVDTYGSYLQLHTCLTYAASVKDDTAIKHLLKAAKYDPCHADAVKEIKRSKDLVFYDSSKLSALLEFLRSIRYNQKEESRHLIRDMCVSAYPDILPWQVQKSCLEFELNSGHVNSVMPCSDQILQDLYYSYLSQLLHPLDGHEDARHDSELLQEFCEWSVGIQPKPSKRRAERLANFLNIASLSNIQHKRFRRDLMMLLEMSVEVGKDDLVLDLIEEILEDKKLLSNKEALHRILLELRKLGNDATASKQSTGFRLLGRVLKLFEKMANSRSAICRSSIVIANELYALFQKWKIHSGSSGDDSTMYLLIDFVISESSSPSDVVRALVLWSSSNNCGNLLFPRLRKLLCLGVHCAALNGELSGTLLRLRHARGMFKELNLVESSSTSGNRSSKDGVGIWESMATGGLSIDK